jgi:hypothetical protein
MMDIDATEVSATVVSEAARLTPLSEPSLVLSPIATRPLDSIDGIAIYMSPAADVSPLIVAASQSAEPTAVSVEVAPLQLAGIEAGNVESAQPAEIAVSVLASSPPAAVSEPAVHSTAPEEPRAVQGPEAAPPTGSNPSQATDTPPAQSAAPIAKLVDAVEVDGTPLVPVPALAAEHTEPSPSSIAHEATDVPAPPSSIKTAASNGEREQANGATPASLSPQHARTESNGAAAVSKRAQKRQEGARRGANRSRDEGPPPPNARDRRRPSPPYDARSRRGSPDSIRSGPSASVRPYDDRGPRSGPGFDVRYDERRSPPGRDHRDGPPRDYRETPYPRDLPPRDVRVMPPYPHDMPPREPPRDMRAYHAAPPPMAVEQPRYDPYYADRGEDPRGRPRQDPYYDRPRSPTLRSARDRDHFSPLAPSAGPLPRVGPPPFLDQAPYYPDQRPSFPDERSPFASPYDGGRLSYDPRPPLYDAGPLPPSAPIYSDQRHPGQRPVYSDQRPPFAEPRPPYSDYPSRAPDYGPGPPAPLSDRRYAVNGGPPRCAYPLMANPGGLMHRMYRGPPGPPPRDYRDYDGVPAALDPYGGPPPPHLPPPQQHAPPRLYGSGPAPPPLPPLMQRGFDRYDRMPPQVPPMSGRLPPPPPQRRY